MSPDIIKALVMCVALTSANFVYVLIKGLEFERAADRSFFQCAAVIICWLAWRSA